MKKIVLICLLSCALLAGCMGGSKTCYETFNTSSEVPHHVHVWCEGDEYTEEYCDEDGECHKHALNENINLAEAAGKGPHTHLLVKI